MSFFTWHLTLQARVLPCACNHAPCGVFTTLASPIAHFQFLAFHHYRTKDVGYYTSNPPTWVNDTRLRNEANAFAALAPVISGPLGMTSTLLFNPVSAIKHGRVATPSMTQGIRELGHSITRHCIPL